MYCEITQDSSTLNTPW